MRKFTVTKTLCGDITQVKECKIDEEQELVFSKSHSSIVLPHMDHASRVWGRFPNMLNNDRISKLQKRSARIILRCKIRDISSKNLFNTMNWMPFYDRVRYKRCLMMYKVNNNLVPQYLQSVTPVTSVHTHNTRSAARDALSTCTANLNYFTRSFKYKGTRLWNNLDSHIKFAPSIATFKQRYLKDYFNV